MYWERVYKTDGRVVRDISGKGRTIIIICDIGSMLVSPSLGVYVKQVPKVSPVVDRLSSLDRRRYCHPEQICRRGQGGGASAGGVSKRDDSTGQVICVTLETVLDIG